MGGLVVFCYSVYEEWELGGVLKRVEMDWVGGAGVAGKGRGYLHLDVGLVVGRLVEGVRVVLGAVGC